MDPNTPTTTFTSVASTQPAGAAYHAPSFTSIGATPISSSASSPPVLSPQPTIISDTNTYASPAVSTSYSSGSVHPSGTYIESYSTVVPPTDPSLEKKGGVRGFWSKMTRPLKYQTQRHSIHSEFHHDNAVSEDINTEKQLSREYTAIGTALSNVVNSEKRYSVDRLRLGHRMNEVSHQFHTSTISEQLKGWTEMELQLAQLHSNFVAGHLSEMDFLLHNFLKSNMKEVKLRKHQANIAAMSRDEYARAYTKKAEAESKKYFEEKHDDMGLRLAEERKLMAASQYDAAATELEVALQSIFQFEHSELLPQFKGFLEAQRAYHEQAGSIINMTLQKICALPVATPELPLQKERLRRGSAQILPQMVPIAPPTSFQAQQGPVPQLATVTTQTISHQPLPTTDYLAPSSSSAGKVSEINDQFRTTSISPQQSIPNA
jgi:hypothetical protein